MEQKDFYNTKTWRKLAEYYRNKHYYLCEQCGNYATEVHHRIHLNKNNISNPSIALNEDNLILLCHDCHNKEHNRFSNKNKPNRTVEFNADGTIKRIIDNQPRQFV